MKRNLQTLATEGLLLVHMRERNLPEPTREYRFHPTRKWRFDFAWIPLLIAVEVEGGIWTMGGHNRGRIYADNCMKYNEAVMLGWSLLRFTTDHINSLYAINTIEEIINQRRQENAERKIR
jgi:very-short-patch-repair endonuclease